MSDYDLSIIIPARNEMFLARTIEDILEHKRGKTEVIAVCDGAWPEPGIPDHKDVKIIYLSESIGQRAATNLGVKLSQAKYVAKCDAHVSFSDGFDVTLMADMQDDWIVAPTMRNLWAFDWKCYDCGLRTYQGPTPKECKQCGKSGNIKRKMVWIAKSSPQSNSFCFDPEPHFQYFREFSKRPEGQGDLTESMSLQGSFFLCTREKYWGLKVCDERFGSWGSQGIEVAAKFWLSGGKVMINHKCYFGHMFRTQGGDFSFPYQQHQSKVVKAKTHAKNLFLGNRWEKQIYPISWLLERFWPVQGWSDEDLRKLKKLDYKVTNRGESDIM